MSLCPAVHGQRAASRQRAEERWGRGRVLATKVGGHTGKVPRPSEGEDDADRVRPTPNSHAWVCGGWSRRRPSARGSRLDSRGVSQSKSIISPRTAAAVRVLSCLLCGVPLRCRVRGNEAGLCAGNLHTWCLEVARPSPRAELVPRLAASPPAGRLLPPPMALSHSHTCTCLPPRWLPLRSTGAPPAQQMAKDSHWVAWRCTYVSVHAIGVRLAQFKFT